ncbi:MAG: tetratricopeptide repeat protein [Candidatus Heimdallarchaeota archaeon]
MKIQDIRDLIYQAKYEEALSQIEELNPKAEVMGLLLKSRIFVLREEYQQAIKAADQAHQKNKGIGDRYQELGAVVMKSYALYRFGKVTEASGLLEEGQELLSLLENGKEWGCLLYDVKARVCWTLGDLQQALLFSYKSLTAAEEFKDEFQIAESLSLVGLMHRSRGELDQSISYLNRAFSLAREAGYRYLESYSRHVIGVTYFYQGDYVKALSSFEQCMTIDEEDEKFDQISCSLFHMVLTSLEVGERNQAQVYLKKLEEVKRDKDPNNRYIDLRQRLAYALVLKNGRRLKDKTDAQRILEEIIHEEIILHDLSIYAMVNLCELLLDELSLYGEPEVLTEAENLSAKIHGIAQEQKSFSLAVEALLLLSRFSLIRGNITRTDTLLEQAESITAEQNLRKLAEKVKDDQTALKEMLEKSEEMLSKGASIHERMKAVRLNEYIARMKNIVRTHG